MLEYIFTISLICSILLIYFMEKEKDLPFAKYLIFGTVLILIWLLCDTMSFLIKNSDISYWFYIYKYPIIMLISPVFYLFAVAFTGYLSRYKKLHLIIFIVPLLSFVSWLTNVYPYPFITETTLTYSNNIPIFSYVPQIGFLIHTIYTYSLLGFTLVLFAIKAFRSSKPYRSRNIFILVGTLFPLGANMIALRFHIIFSMFEANSVDATSIFMFISMVIIYFSAFRSQLGYEAMEMQIEMENALKNNEFSLYLQPQIASKDNGYEVIGAEALIRWIRNDKFLYTPDKFITLAELNGMIIPIGNWVIDEVFRINERLYNKGISTKLSINVSSVQLKDIRFIKHLEKTYDKNKNIPIDLVIEVTESFLMDQEEKSIKHLNTIKELGINIALDDFGTGFSSLSYLRKLPLDYLKIDKSFIDDIVNDKLNLTPHILSIANTLGLETIAEGVETLDQVEFLAEDQCNYIQGYYFSKPLTEHTFVQYVEKWNNHQ